MCEPNKTCYVIEDFCASDGVRFLPVLKDYDKERLLHGKTRSHWLHIAHNFYCQIVVREIHPRLGTHDKTSVQEWFT